MQPRGNPHNMSRPQAIGTSTESNQQTISTSAKGPQDIIIGIPSQIAQISRVTERPPYPKEIHQDVTIVDISPQASAPTLHRWDTPA